MIRKRSKRSRLRGSKWCGFGHKFKHRGSGSRGGVGMAGTGKMAGHRRTYILRYMPDYLGKSGFHSKNIKSKIINLNEIQNKLTIFLKNGIAKKVGKETEINLKGYKILAKGKIGSGLIIKAGKFSEKAKKRILESGSKAEVI